MRGRTGSNRRKPKGLGISRAELPVYWVDKLNAQSEGRFEVGDEVAPFVT